MRSTSLFRALTLTAFAITCLTGCGVGFQAAPGANIAPTFSGHAFGGPNAIIGATVKIYATGNTPGDGTITNSGYGVGTMLQEATQVGISTGQDTDSNGNFTFAGGYDCPAGQFAYIVATGGDTGGNAVNANSVLVAALGRCEDLYTLGSGVYSGYKGSNIFINELTTIAAAYSLGHFSTESGTGAATVVSIGAPATNNAPQVSGTSIGYSGAAATATASLTSNAVSSIALGTANTVAYLSAPTVTITGGGGSGATATATINSSGIVTGFTVTSGGSGYTSVPLVSLSLPAASAGLAHAFLNAANLVNVFVNAPVMTGANTAPTSNSSAVVPQQLLNTMGNILVTCVNSTGGHAGDSTACGQIFTATTIGANVPVDTFGAMVNLAANPTLGGSTTAVANFFNIQSAFTAGVYSPALSNATGLNDYSIAIMYPSSLGIKYVQSGALDMNDVYYAGNVTTTGSGPVNILTFGSNGALLGTSGSNTTLKNSFSLAIDAKGFGYFGNGSGSGSNVMGSFATGSGSIGGATVNTVTASTSGEAAKAYALAIDRSNNLWVIGTASSGSTLFKGAAGTATPTLTGVATPTVTAPGSNFIGLSIDPQQNVWLGASTVMDVFPNSGSLASPAYANSLITATPTGNPVTGFAFAGSASSYTVYPTSYGQTASTEGVNTYTPGYSAGLPTITSLGSDTLSDPVNGANPVIIGSAMGESDGSGTIWLADTNSKSVIQYTPGTSATAYRFQPCMYNSAVTANTQCITAFTNKPVWVSIDSAGSIWTQSPLNGGGAVLEIIGSAAPTWPLLALGNPSRP